MAVKDDKFIVGTEPILIAKGSHQASAVYKTVMIRAASATFHVGGPSVNIADGFPIYINEVFMLELGPQDDLYAVSAGAVSINVLITGSEPRVGSGEP